MLWRSTMSEPWLWRPKEKTSRKELPSAIKNLSRSYWLIEYKPPELQQTYLIALDQCKSNNFSGACSWMNSQEEEKTCPYRIAYIKNLMWHSKIWSFTKCLLHWTRADEFQVFSFCFIKRIYRLKAQSCLMFKSPFLSIMYINGMPGKR